MSQETIQGTAPEPRFKVGVVSSGGLGGDTWISAALAVADEGVEVVAVTDPDIDRARSVGEEVGVPVFDRVKDMIDKTDLDGVILSKTYVAGAKYALEAGLHVFWEEPFGPNGEARDVMRAAERQDRVLGTGYWSSVPVVWALENIRRTTGRSYTVGSYTMWDRGLGNALGGQLAVGLALLGSPPVKVRTLSSDPGGDFGGMFSNIYTLVVECESGGVGQHIVSLGQSDATGSRIITRGAQGPVRMSFSPEELSHGNFVPTLIGHDGKPWSGDLPTPSEAALVIRVRDWVKACRGEQEPIFRPEAGLDVYQVLETARGAEKSPGQWVRLQDV